MIFGYIFYNLSPHYLFFIIYYFFKIKKYIISGDKEVTNGLIKKMSNQIIYTEITHNNGRNHPSGLFIGNLFLSLQKTVINSPAPMVYGKNRHSPVSSISSLKA